MGNDWQAALLRRIAGAMHFDGGLPYTDGATPAAEPTAYAALALAAREPPSETAHRALDWLAQRQLDHGGVPVSPQVQRPCWTTAPALLAWLRGERHAQQRFADNARRATRWLLKTRAETTEPALELYDHDTTESEPHSPVFRDEPKKDRPPASVPVDVVNLRRNLSRKIPVRHEYSSTAWGRAASEIPGSEPREGA